MLISTYTYLHVKVCSNNFEIPCIFKCISISNVPSLCREKGYMFDQYKLHSKKHPKTMKILNKSQTVTTSASKHHGDGVRCIVVWNCNNVYTYIWEKPLMLAKHEVYISWGTSEREMFYDPIATGSRVSLKW